MPKRPLIQAAENPYPLSRDDLEALFLFSGEAPAHWDQNTSGRADEGSLPEFLHTVLTARSNDADFYESCGFQKPDAYSPMFITELRT